MRPRLLPYDRARTLSRDAGFSLLEILAVLVIIGVMSAVVVLSLTPPRPAAQDRADQFVLRVNQLAKEAIYSGRPNALSISEEGLHLMQFANGRWTALQAIPFEGRIKTVLEIEDERVRDIPEEPSPLILFEPTGEVTDFSLTVSGTGLDLRLFRADDGTIQLGRLP